MAMGLKDFAFNWKMFKHKFGRQEIVGELKRAGQRFWRGYDDSWYWSMDSKTEEMWLEVLKWMQNCAEYDELTFYNGLQKKINEIFDATDKKKIFNENWLRHTQKSIVDFFGFIGNIERKFKKKQDGRFGSPELQPEEEALFECSKANDWKDLDCHDRWSRILHELVELLAWEEKEWNAYPGLDKDMPDIMRFEKIENGCSRLVDQKEYMTEDELRRYNAWSDGLSEIERIGREKKDKAIELIVKLWTRFWD